MTDAEALLRALVTRCEPTTQDLMVHLGMDRPRVTQALVALDAKGVLHPCTRWVQTSAGAQRAVVRWRLTDAVERQLTQSSGIN